MRFALLLLALSSRLAAQATTVSAPEDNYLLEITEGWGKASALGELRVQRMTPSDREVRLWVGYGLVGTRGVILRHVDGMWQGWHATVVTCHLIIPTAVGDTLSTEAMKRYHAEAKARCGQPSAREGLVISTDTLQIRPLAAVAVPDSLWQQLVAEGLFSLPPSVPRSWVMMDGTTFVLEVRKGEVYRASVIELTTPPEGEADQRIQSIAALLAPYM